MHSIAVEQMTIVHSTLTFSTVTGELTIIVSSSHSEQIWLWQCLGCVVRPTRPAPSCWLTFTSVLDAWSDDLRLPHRHIVRPSPHCSTNFTTEVSLHLLLTVQPSPRDPTFTAPSDRHLMVRPSSRDPTVTSRSSPHDLHLQHWRASSLTLMFIAASSAIR